MKKYLGMVVLTFAALVLAGVYFIMVRETDPSKTGKFFSINPSDSIIEIRIMNTFGDFVFVKTDDTWQIVEPGIYNVNQQKMMLIETALLDLQINRTLDLEIPEYGLGEPEVVVEFFTERGIHRILSVGNRTPSNAQVYIKDVQSGQVFVANIGAVVQFDGSLTAYRGKEVFSINKDQVTEITYFNDGVKVLTISNLGPQNWQITYPINAPARNIEISEFVVAMRKWTAIGYPETSGGEYAQFGLDNPKKSLLLTDADGKTQTLEFGDTTGSLIYVRTGSEEDIVQLFRVDVDFSLLTVEQLLFVLPLQTRIDNVAEITIESSQSTSTFKLDHSKTPVEITLSGEQVLYEDFVTLFVRYIGLSAIGFDSQTTPGARVLRLTTTFLDGSIRTIDLLERNSESYFIGSVDNGQFYVNKAQVDMLLLGWQKIVVSRQ